MLLLNKSVNVKVSALVLAALVLPGCASSPDKMTTAYVSPLMYKNHDCDQLIGELDRVSRQENTLYQSLKKESDSDNAQMAVGMLLFWPALFFLEGGDSPQAADYSRIKGEKVAIEHAAIQKKCSADIMARAEVIQLTGKKVNLRIKGYDDSGRSLLALDRDEAGANAKLQALEKAGYNVGKITREANVNKRNENINKKASQVLVPGYKVKDKGYQKDGRYLVEITGKAFEVRPGSGASFNHQMANAPEKETEVKSDVTSVNQSAIVASKADVSVQDRLKELKSLYEAKLITQEEYDEKRKETLDSML